MWIWRPEAATEAAGRAQAAAIAEAGPWRAATRSREASNLNIVAGIFLELNVNGNTGGLAYGRQ